MNLGLFILNALVQVSQWMYSAHSGLTIDLCCVGETRIQNSRNLMQLTAPNISL